MKFNTELIRQCWRVFIDFLLLAFFSFLPGLVDIGIAALTDQSLKNAFDERIIPAEIVAYSLGFIVPLFVLFTNTHGKNYKLPYIKGILPLFVITYIAATVLIIYSKNQYVPGIDNSPNHSSRYFYFSIALLCVSIFLRLYTAFHEAGYYSNYQSYRKEEQNSFNDVFKKIITKNG